MADHGGPGPNGGERQNDAPEAGAGAGAEPGGARAGQENGAPRDATGISDWFRLLVHEVATPLRPWLAMSVVAFAKILFGLLATMGIVLLISTFVVEFMLPKTQPLVLGLTDDRSVCVDLSTREFLTTTPTPTLTMTPTSTPTPVPTRA